jgi:hypothetical protein
MIKLISVALVAFAVCATTVADAQHRRGQGSGMEKGQQGKRACNFQKCYDRCITRGGLKGSPKNGMHCGNRCARRCPQN